MTYIFNVGINITLKWDLQKTGRLVQEMVAIAGQRYGIPLKAGRKAA